MKREASMQCTCTGQLDAHAHTCTGGARACAPHLWVEEGQANVQYTCTGQLDAHVHDVRVHTLGWKKEANVFVRESE